MLCVDAQNTQMATQRLAVDVHTVHSTESWNHGNSYYLYKLGSRWPL